MTEADVDVLLPWEHEMFGSEAWSRRSYLDELSDREHRHYLAAQESELAPQETEPAAQETELAPQETEENAAIVVGAAGLLTLGETAQILTVAVLPSARRRGVARLLISELITEASRRNAEEVLLEVRVDNAAARALYVGAGFSELGLRRGYYDRGRVDAVTMRKVLR